MSTWYEVSKWNYRGPPITPVEVQRNSDSSVWIDGRRAAITSECSRYFPTWEEAKAHLVDRETKSVEYKRSALAKAESDLAAALKLEKPNV